jgi:hypothetical protein
MSSQEGELGTLAFDKIFLLEFLLKGVAGEELFYKFLQLVYLFSLKSDHGNRHASSSLWLETKSSGQKPWQARENRSLRVRSPSAIFGIPINNSGFERYVANDRNAYNVACADGAVLAPRQRGG